jgi:radical SAM superfamily enzyme YgiQ (UPF0313 family)
VLSRRFREDPPSAVLVHCFDDRTRILPFVFADTRIVPAGVRQVAASLLESGVLQLRIVLQQWTPAVEADSLSLGGRRPDLLLLSAMSLHTAPLDRLLAQVCRIPPRERPLVVCGGPKAIYEGRSLFHVGGDPEVSADLVCRGEDYVLLEALERVTADRAEGETLRAAFLRARADGRLRDVPGLTYLGEEDGRAFSLVETGSQRLLLDLDELPMGIAALAHLERPHRGRELAAAPLPTREVVRRAPITPVEMTRGCRLVCGYCPIPAYNQRSFRRKSGARVAAEMHAFSRAGQRLFFGTDDNFLDSRPAAHEIVETVARHRFDHRGDPTVVWRWGTEATLTDTHRCLDLLPVARSSGMQALWFGIEDLTATLVDKGQSATKTETVFRALQDNGIMPMPMLMHSDGQPLRTREGLAGLLNQVRFVRRAGGGALALFHLVPSPGSRGYEHPFEQGLVLETVGGEPVEKWRHDGGYVVATAERRPWRRQLDFLAAYATFYNPLQMLLGPLRRRRAHLFAMDLGLQAIGIAGLVPTILAGLRWALALRRGPLTWSSRPPFSAESR